VELAAAIVDVVDPAEDLRGLGGVVGSCVLGCLGGEGVELAVEGGDGALFEDDDEPPLVLLAEGEGGLAGVEGVEEQADGQGGEGLLEPG